MESKKSKEKNKFINKAAERLAEIFCMQIERMKKKKKIY